MRRALLDWYRAHQRPLPWRETRDPYAIWISEAMLQQTRVETVIPYYRRFLERFPDVRALASADLDDVLGAWAGLGYYSRARNLRSAARKVVADFDGELPDDPEALRSLPGVGRYTAGALASIAFDQPEPVVDGNVARVLSRLLGIRDDVGSPTVAKRLWEAAAKLVRGPDPGDLNQALMELGAVVCTPRGPRCDACPIRRSCDARRRGDAESLPRKAKATPVRRVEAVAAWVARRGRVLAVRRIPRGLLGGLWELPGDELGARERPARGIRRALADRVGLRVDRADDPVGRVRLRDLDAHRWLGAGGLARLPQGALTKKALGLLGSREKQR